MTSKNFFKVLIHDDKPLFAWIQYIAVGIAFNIIYLQHESLPRWAIVILLLFAIVRYYVA